MRMYTYGWAHGVFGTMGGWSPFGGLFVGAFAALAILLVVWSLFWQALAMWQAARNRQWLWFIVFLLVHTLGILEIIYLIWFRPNRDTIDIFDRPKTHTPTPPASSPVA